MNWRDFKHQPEGIKVEKVERLPALPPFSTFPTLIPAEEVLKNIEQAKAIPPLKRATSYPCGKCDGTYYTEVQGGWQCDGCTMVLKSIGGKRGPEIIQEG